MPGPNSKPSGGKTKYNRLRGKQGQSLPSKTLLARQKAWDEGKPDDKYGTKRPGSQKK